MKRTIKAIYVGSLDRAFTTEDGFNPGRPGCSLVVVGRIERITKNGELAEVPWLDIHGVISGVMEVPESGCIIACLDGRDLQ